MWSRRAQEYEAKINSGDIVAIAEVVSDLYRSESQPEQSYSERQLYEAALDRLSREIAVVQHGTETEAVKEIEGQLAKSPRRGAKAETEVGADGEADADTDGDDTAVAEDAEALHRAVDRGHAVRQRFNGIAGLRGNDFYSKRPRGLNFLQRQAAEGIHGFARVAVALGGLLLGGENEAVDVAAEAQRVDPELPLIALRGGRCRREAIDRQILGRGFVDVFHPAGIQIVAERLFRRYPHDIEAHGLGAALAHADHGLRGIVQRERIGCGEGEAELGMQEAPAPNESFARILPVDDVVDGGEIGFAIALAALRRGELPGSRLCVLYALRRCRMRGEKILSARIERGLSHFQLGVTLHRRQETRCAEGIEMGARRNTDANTVRFEFLGA